MIKRWIEEDGLLDTLESRGHRLDRVLAPGVAMLKAELLGGVPEGSRAGKKAPSFRDGFLSDDNLKRIAALNEIAARRGQSLAQMAIAWVLRGGRVAPP